MRRALKNMDESTVLACSIVHDDEWHYDDIDDITWKEGRYGGESGG